jgi:hypothetical protein
VAALSIGAVLLLAACGGKSSPATTAASTTTTTPTFSTTLPTTPNIAPASCSAWGKAFQVSFNKTAIRKGNPERMLDVCCGPKSGKGVSHCVLTLGLVGTKDRGCEAVDLDSAGTPVSIGRHVACARKT